MVKPIITATDCQASLPVTASDGTVIANASGMMNVKPYRSHPG